MNILEKFESDQIKELSKNKNFPVFKPGDTLKIFLKVKEGEKERIQMFEGVCIALKNAGINTSFSVRKISYGEGVERVFPIFSPQISKIEVAKFGMLSTKDLIATKGRASFLGERAKGHIDPGARSSQLAIEAICNQFIIKDI